MYKLRLSRHEKKKLLRLRWLIVLVCLVLAGLVIWLAWIRPVQREANIRTFEECVAAGNPVQETYPEVCLAKDGKRFVNPKHDQAHQASLAGEEELVPPTNPALLKLDIEEWGIRIPLTMATFDLMYAYVEDGGSEYLMFTYKRLVQLDVCKGDIGLKVNRSRLKREPPYTDSNPAPLAQLDNYYFYANYADALCYDDKNVEQSTLVKTIAGDQNLKQSTAGLLSKLIAIPKE